jgi:hypothetical protein
MGDRRHTDEEIIAHGGWLAELCMNQRAHAMRQQQRAEAAERRERDMAAELARVKRELATLKSRVLIDG